MRVASTNARAACGSVGCASDPSDPSAKWPTCASTETPLACAKLTTRSTRGWYSSFGRNSFSTITESKPNTRWLVGTELNLVNRLAETLKPQGKVVQFMAPTVCMCSTMARIDPQHLAWTLENLVDGNIVNPIRVPAREAGLARTALKRMLDVA